VVTEPAERLRIELYKNEHSDLVFAICPRCTVTVATCLVGRQMLVAVRCLCGFPFFRSVHQHKCFVLLAKVVGPSLPALQAFFDDEEPA